MGESNETPQRRTGRRGGSFLVVLAVVLAVMFAPQFAFAAVIALLPVPVAILAYKKGLPVAILGVLAASVVMLPILGPLGAIAVLLQVGLVGIVLGEAFRERFRPGYTLVLVAVGFLFSTVALHFVSEALVGVNLVDAFMEMSRAYFDDMVELWTETGLSAEQLEVLEARLEDFLVLARTLLPGSLVISSLAAAFWNHWVAHLALNRPIQKLGGVGIPWFPPFRQWRFPWYFAWGYIAGQGGTLLLNVLGLGQDPTALVSGVAANLTLVFSTLFLLQGLAIVWFYLHKYRVNAFLRVLVLFVLLMPSPLLTNLVIWVGVLDVWLNLRRI